LGAGRDSTRMWRASRVNIAAEAADFYDVMSPRFRVSVTPEEFQTWATNISVEHGALQSLRRAKKVIVPTQDKRFVVHFTGEFVNGPADIAVTIGLNGWTPEIDNIEVDGVAALIDG